MTSGKTMSKMVYKICESGVWAKATAAGRFSGSADDHRDGFIHLSTADQLAGTLARHFSDTGGRGRSGLLLVAIEASCLGAALKWEPARDGALFPHLYSALDTSLAVGVDPIVVAADGRHVLPGATQSC